MKLNLTIGGTARAGFINIDPGAPEGGGEDGRVRGELGKLEAFADANECEHIVAMGVLDAFEMTAVDAVLDNWLSRLAHKGRLSLSVVDFREVSRAFLAGQLGLDDVNILIHGNGFLRQCSLTLSQLVDVLTHKGLKVLLQRVEHYQAVVVAERP